VPERVRGEAAKALLARGRYFTRGVPSGDGRTVIRDDTGRAEAFYRDRWRHDKVVRSTHGVNCTGSCSWRVFVRDGIISWEVPADDYPETAPGMPDEEPRGCPRGASFSWYIYNPGRIRYPYVRGVLWELWEDARRIYADPVEAWASIARDRAKSERYKAARGHAGFVRASWDELLELVAAVHVFTILEYGPDRVASYSPNPAMSLVSQASGVRYTALTGGAQLSFYDWHADLPPASPQVLGDQTDVPESADWWNAGYLIIWGTNIPVTRTPDAHFMVEARYRGQKVVTVSPDYAEHVKFGDEWLPVSPGEDGALAMAMGHVVLKEFFVERQVPFFTDYVTRYTDLPCLVLLREHNGAYVIDRFLTEADLQGAEAAGAEPGGRPEPTGGEAPAAGPDSEHGAPVFNEPESAWKTVVWDTESGGPAVPNGSQGFRWAESGQGRWNLDLGAVKPLLTFLDAQAREDRKVPEVTVAEVELPRFDLVPPGVVRRSVPAAKLGGRFVTTVFDLLLAQYGVARAGLPGRWPSDYADKEPYTPAWQEDITGVAAEQVARIAREFAANAEATNGRSMILIGSGVNHWFHADITYRAVMTLLMLCGCIGRNGGGWAHYVGQEKVRPLGGFLTVATALDWGRPVRHTNGTEWYYAATDQWRYEAYLTDTLCSPLGKGLLRGKAAMDALVQAERLGWQLTYPTFDRNPLELGEEAAEAADNGEFLNDFMARRLRDGTVRFSVTDPDDPRNWPRLMFVWRANVLGSSGKGHEYFLRHLIGSDVGEIPARESLPGLRPEEVEWRGTPPSGKLDLLVNLDFRMTSTGAFADIILPAATWYEKSDLSCTDLHSYVHSFNAAVDPPWEARSDWDAFRELARVFSRLAAKHLGVRKDLVATALGKDTPAEAAQPFGRVRDWQSGEVDLVPGRTAPVFTLVERDYGAVFDEFVRLGPAIETRGVSVKGVSWDPSPEIEWLRQMSRDGTAHGIARPEPDLKGDRPLLYTPEQAAEAILALSGATNGRVARAGYENLSRRTGMPLAERLGHEPAQHIRWSDVQARPYKTLTSPEWSGDEAGTRPYAPFVLQVEHLVPWRTLTGRMQFLVDHEWMEELGEQLPTYRPPLNLPGEYPERLIPSGEGVVLRYLTPHSKWSIHSDFQDNPLMLTLFRGGPVLWMSPEDAAAIEVKDNDWVEMWNRNGFLDCRAVVSRRMPRGLCYMYHAKDRHVQVPRVEATGKPGGTDNSLTRILLKPTHMIGGYSQLSFAPNYYGCCGTQRDEVIVVRRRRNQKVTF